MTESAGWEFTSLFSWELEFHSFSSWKCGTPIFLPPKKRFIHVSLSCFCALFFILQMIFAGSLVNGCHSKTILYVFKLAQLTSFESKNR